MSKSLASDLKIKLCRCGQELSNERRYEKRLKGVAPPVERARAVFNNTLLSFNCKACLVSARGTSRGDLH